MVCYLQRLLAGQGQLLHTDKFVFGVHCWVFALLSFPLEDHVHLDSIVEISCVERGKKGKTMLVKAGNSAANY